MSDFNSSIIKEKIVEFRKRAGLTQEVLADKLSISFQAVSKWENGQSCPDISLLPKLADIFSISLDELFGRIASVPVKNTIVENVPWTDDDKLRVVLFRGKKFLENPVEEANKITFEYKGEALNIESQVAVTCGDVQGNAKAVGSIKCGNVEGNASANGSVSCGGVEGNVSSNGTITCESVQGDVSANGQIICTSVEGDVSSNSNIVCTNVGGDVEADGDVSCITVSGDVTAKIVKCKEIHGDVYSDNIQDCDE